MTRPRPRPRRWRQVAPALVAGAFAATLASAAAAVPATAPAGTPAETLGAPALDVEVLGLEPVVLTGDGTLTLTLALRNGTDATIESATVDLLGQEWTPNNRSSLVRWLELDRYGATLPLHSETLGSLAAGERRQLVITVPAASFRVDAWGPRGIEVRATPRVAGAALEPDRERTWVLHWNAPAVEPTRAAFLLPVTPTPAEMTGGPLTRLRSLLDLDVPGVTFALDPAVLALADDQSTLDALLTAEFTAVSGESFVLPWGNADAAALLHAGRTSLYADLVARGAATLDEAGARAAGSLDWPATPDRATLAGTGGDVVALPDTLFPERDPLAHTRDALASVDGRAAVVLDGRLGDALRGDAAGTPLTALQQRQFLAASLAVVTRERPRESRLVVIALPFDADDDVAPLLEAVAGVPWVEPAGLAGALAADAPALDPGVIPAEPELPEGALTDFGPLDAATAGLALAEQLAVDPSGFADPLAARLSLYPSATWRQEPAAREAMLRSVAADAAAVTGGLAVADSSPINMISESANFPVRITSTAPVDTSVRVLLFPSDRWLHGEAVDVVVPAGGEAVVQVPVTAVGWGDLTVRVQLATVGGVWVGDPVDIPVRIRADWENMALTALTAGACAAFAFGVWRTIRRNRATGRAAQLDAAAEELDAALREQEMA